MRTLRRFTSRFATPGAAFQSSIGESVIDHLLNGAAEPLVRTARKDDVALAQRQPLRVLLAEDNASTRGSASRRNSS
jgi:hypothetical protein